MLYYQRLAISCLWAEMESSCLLYQMSASNLEAALYSKTWILCFNPATAMALLAPTVPGKSTFLRILSGDLEPSTGEISIPDNERMSVLKQDHFQYDAYTVLDTVIMGNPKLYDIMKEKEALYAKEDFSDADGERASYLEGEFAEMNGWEAETEVQQILQGLGIESSLLYAQMNTLKESEKVKILLAQALFGQPQIILLDEPTNGLDLPSVDWLEDFLLTFPEPLSLYLMTVTF